MSGPIRDPLRHPRWDEAVQAVVDLIEPNAVKTISVEGVHELAEDILKEVAPFIRAQAIRDVVQALRDRADAIRGVAEALQDDEQRGFHEWADRQAPSDFIERWARERGDL